MIRPTTAVITQTTKAQAGGHAASVAFLLVLATLLTIALSAAVV